MNKQYYEALTFEQWAGNPNKPAIPSTLHLHKDVEMYLLPVEGIVISEEEFRKELNSAWSQGAYLNSPTDYINLIISKYKDNGK